VSLKRDYLLRLVEQLTHALAKILKLRQAGQHEAAAREAEDAAASLCGMPLSLAGSVDAPQLARMVGDSAKLAALARVMWERAGVAADARDAALEATWQARARAAWREAERGGAELDEVGRKALVSG
jgi:hypothetical protein